MSYNGISYECKCGYSYAEYYGNCSSDPDSLLCNILDVTTRKASCKECGFVQPKIAEKKLSEHLKSFRYHNQEEIPDVDTIVKGLEKKAYECNNNNRCKKCNGELEEIRLDIDIGWFRLSDYSYQKPKPFECPTCEEFKEVSATQEYYLDTGTKEVVRKDEIYVSTCNVCDSELQKVQIKEFVKPVIHNIDGKYTYGAEDVTLVKCPKCKKFDIERDEFHWH